MRQSRKRVCNRCTLLNLVCCPAKGISERTISQQFWLTLCHKRYVVGTWQYPGTGY